MNNWQREQMPRNWRGKEARKSEIAMWDCIKWPRKSGRRMENKCNRYIKFETADRERSERKFCFIVHAWRTMWLRCSCQFHAAPRFSIKDKFLLSVSVGPFGVGRSSRKSSSLMSLMTPTSIWNCSQKYNKLLTLWKPYAMNHLPGLLDIHCSYNECICFSIFSMNNTKYITNMYTYTS